MVMCKRNLNDFNCRGHCEAQLDWKKQCDQGVVS